MSQETTTPSSAQREKGVFDVSVRMWWGVFTALVAIIGLAGPLLDGFNYPIDLYYLGAVAAVLFGAAVVIGFLGGRSFINYLQQEKQDLIERNQGLTESLSQEREDIREDLESEYLEKENLGILNKNRVHMDLKEVEIDLKDESESSVLRYRHQFRALDPSGVDKFYAIVGFKGDERLCEDLNLTPTGGRDIETLRRDREVDGTVWKRYNITFDLYETVTENSPYPFSYSLDYPEHKVSGHFTELLIREETDVGRIKVNFPKDWRPVQRRVTIRSLTEKEKLERHTAIRETNEDGSWSLSWECGECHTGDVIKLTWRAEKIDDKNEIENGREREESEQTASTDSLDAPLKNNAIVEGLQNADLTVEAVQGEDSAE